jgi:hypothetical protein
MKRMLAVLALLIGLGGGMLSAQTRVSVSLGFGAPFVAYQPRPYGYGYSHDYGYGYRYPYRRYVVYDPRPTIIVVHPYRHGRVFVERGRSWHRHHRW